MGGFIFIGLIAMFIIGVVHLLSGLILLITARNKNERNNWAYYFAGVAGYFLLIFITSGFVEMRGMMQAIWYVLFVGGALGLGSYHTYIWTTLRRRSAETV